MFDLVPLVTDEQLAQLTKDPDPDIREAAFAALAGDQHAYDRCCFFYVAGEVHR